MKNKYFLQLVGLSALWGTTFVFTRIAVPSLGPNLLACARMLIATVVLWGIMRLLKQQWPWHAWREALLLGAIAVAGPHFFYAWASINLPAGYGSLLAATSVIFGAAASVAMREDSLNRWQLVGCIAGFIGVALVVRLGPVQPSAQLFLSAGACLCGAALSGIATPFLKRATTRMEPLAITASMHVAGAILLLPGAVMDLPNARWQLSAIVAVLLMGALTSGLAYWMYMRIMRHVPPLAALSSTFLITGFGVAFSVLLLHEQTGPGLYAGGVLIVISAMMVMRFNPLNLFVQKQF